MREIKHLSIHQWIRFAIPDSQQPNLSYRFPIFETSATALCGTTGIYIYMYLFFLSLSIYTYIYLYLYLYIYTYILIYIYLQKGVIHHTTPIIIPNHPTAASHSLGTGISLGGLACNMPWASPPFWLSKSHEFIRFTSFSKWNTNFSLASLSIFFSHGPFRSQFFGKNSELYPKNSPEILVGIPCRTWIRCSSGVVSTILTLRCTRWLEYTHDWFPPNDPPWPTGSYYGLWYAHHYTY